MALTKRTPSPKHAAEKAARRAARVAELAARRALAETREATIQAALKKGSARLTPEAIVEFLGSDQQPDWNNRLRQRFNIDFLDLWGTDRHTGKRIQFVTFAKQIFEKAPKLFDDNAAFQRLWLLFICPHARTLADWKPDGRSRDSIFRSLVRHMAVKYPMPQFLYGIFDAVPVNGRYRDNENDLLLFSHLATGGSVVEAVKMDLIRTALAKRACHFFMQAPSDCSVPQAVRYAQVRFYKGDRRVFAAISNSFLKDYQPNEPFWDTVIQWICAVEMLDPAQVGPLLDYIRFRKGQDNQRDEQGHLPTPFTMKGRTATSLLQGMEQWHTGLARLKKIQSHVYQPSGFKSGFWEEGTEHKKQTWTIHEILTSSDLFDEGRRMRHCIYSYSWSIQDGNISVWSLQRHTQTEGNMKFLTIEVSNRNRHVVQARGLHNRAPTARELTYLHRWGMENNLTVSVSGGW